MSWLISGGIVLVIVPAAVPKVLFRHSAQCHVINTNGNKLAVQFYVCIFEYGTLPVQRVAFIFHAQNTDRRNLKKNKVQLMERRNDVRTR